ncbi:nitrate reductase molybdenum cofactor assembly chaperone [Aneurinibacillus terranovensis]|uniref:nitrate reductase molybdenum cofactor assembly chaperone n=1 Tax=Aneurinibacillus terranovensis TaxID=278991 RepID=UPI0004092E8D|nr:nitrate reductase molybdenum cofactor assembly chaperone [Aneurinibacillus terranovensis]
MITSQHELVKIISFLLGYPDTSFFAAMDEAEEWVNGLPLTRAGDSLIKGIAAFRSMEPHELQKHYVSVFDFRESTSLYLTAHELGDSKERGQALLELRKMVREAGFEEPDGELPDYMPLLLELLAVKPEYTDMVSLAARIAAASLRIKQKISNTSPYYYVFAAIEAVLPKVSPADITREQQQRNEADVDELPYPLYYEH